jgi:hypothetical protein
MTDMWNWKTKLAILGVPAALALGSTGVVAIAAAPPAATPATTSSPAAPSAAPEAAEPTTEPVEANEPNLPGGGHSDPAGQADHQFDGVE